VRSNPEGNAGKLLEDWRRINVALTRARRKLVLVGCRATLSRVPMLADLWALAQRRGWVVALPADALEM
jgi:DNA replication ATP-dependent helicase Dna2